VTVDNSDTLRVVKELTSTSDAYWRHFNLWLGGGSAGGIVAILSFAANLPNPDFALRSLLPSLCAFLVGVVAAGSSLLFIANRESAAAWHFTNAFNRTQLENAIRQMPEAFSSPERIASEMNAGRNKMITQNLAAHNEAEKAWKLRHRWNWGYWICILLASVGFLTGASWPIWYILFNGKLVP
jgi:hypothetical protein